MHQIVVAQISDLHIGLRLMNSWSKISKKEFLGVPNPMAMNNPHDHRLLNPLVAALNTARDVTGAENVHVLISGDVTQNGIDNDFAVASAILYTRFQRKRKGLDCMFGLGWKRDDVMSVAGNHDQWCNRILYPTAYSRTTAAEQFKRCPWSRTLSSQSGRLLVEFWGVDSNSGLKGVATPFRPRLDAAGSIDGDELLALRDKLGESDEEIKRKRREEHVDFVHVRAVICHHAFSKESLLPSPLDKASRDELLAIARDFKIPVVLTGHTHVARFKRWPASPKGNEWVLFERRCATTLQGPKIHGVGKRGGQGLLLHQITASDDLSNVQWKTWELQMGKSRFEILYDAPHVIVRSRDRWD